MEGLNGFFPATKRNRRGYRTTKNCLPMHYFVAGKLRIPLPLIPLEISRKPHGFGLYGAEAHRKSRAYLVDHPGTGTLRDCGGYGAALMLIDGSLSHPSTPLLPPTTEWPGP